MEYWKDANEAVTTIRKLLEEELKDPELGKIIPKMNQLIVFDYSQDGPGAKVWLNAKEGEAAVGIGDPEGKPGLIMSLSADDAHRAWSNKLNPVIAIARKKIRVKGSAAALLKLAPKAKAGAKIYNRVLTELGMEDKILK